MKAGIHGRQIDLEPNSPPLLLKRIVADGFDTVLILGLFLLLTALLLKTPLAGAYHNHFERYQAMERAAVEEYGNDTEAIGEALSKDSAYQEERFAANLHSYLLKAAACFVAEALVLLAVPLLNGKRATPGKQMAGIMPFNEKRQSRATGPQTVYRFVYVFLIDSLTLYLYTGILTFLLVPVLRLTEVLLNRKRKTLCDFITGILIIETLSYDGIN